MPALEKDCMVLTPFCDIAEWEDTVKVGIQVCRCVYYTVYSMVCMCIHIL